MYSFPLLGNNIYCHWSSCEVWGPTGSTHTHTRFSSGGFEDCTISLAHVKACIKLSLNFWMTIVHVESRLWHRGVQCWLHCTHALTHTREHTVFQLVYPLTLFSLSQATALHQELHPHAFVCVLHAASHQYFCERRGALLRFSLGEHGTGHGGGSQVYYRSSSSQQNTVCESSLSIYYYYFISAGKHLINWRRTLAK